MTKILLVVARPSHVFSSRWSCRWSSIGGGVSGTLGFFIFAIGEDAISLSSSTHLGYRVELN